MLMPALVLPNISMYTMQVCFLLQPPASLSAVY
jgi:hypothetical protein